MKTQTREFSLSLNEQEAKDVIRCCFHGGLPCGNEAKNKLADLLQKICETKPGA